MGDNNRETVIINSKTTKAKIININVGNSKGTANWNVQAWLELTSKSQGLKPRGTCRLRIIPETSCSTNSHSIKTTELPGLLANGHAAVYVFQSSRVTRSVPMHARNKAQLGWLKQQERQCWGDPTVATSVTSELGESPSWRANSQN